MRSTTAGSASTHWHVRPKIGAGSVTTTGPASSIPPSWTCAATTRSTFLAPTVAHAPIAEQVDDGVPDAVVVAGARPLVGAATPGRERDALLEGTGDDAARLQVQVDVDGHVVRARRDRRHQVEREPADAAVADVARRLGAEPGERHDVLADVQVRVGRCALADVLDEHADGRAVVEHVDVGVTPSV